MRISNQGGLGAAIALVAVTALSGCSTSQDPLTQAALQGEPFTIADVVGDSVEKAYVFCQYTTPELGEDLGFQADDFFSMDDNPQAWETHTGIGTLVQDGSSQVEWFDPREVSACEGTIQSGTEVDPRQQITVQKETREFADGKSAEVAVLSY